MFAFAVWDAGRRRLLLARDRMGEKPLYYHAGGGAFVFGSELRALLEHPAVPRALSLPGLARYLAFEYVPAPHSILAEVVKLPPAHTLTVSADGTSRLAAYWRPSFAATEGVDEREWAARVVGALERSVEQCMVSDVPLGVFLSGGVDSSAVAGIAARLRGRQRLDTFSLGFVEPTYDERAHARSVARHFGTAHHEVLFSGDDAVASMEKAGDLFDEPLVDPSFLPFHFLSSAARQTVTVALSGDGGDEVFCGYPTFIAEKAASWVRRVPGPLRRVATAAVTALPPSTAYGSPTLLLKQFFRGLPYPRAVRTQLLLGGLTGEERDALLTAPVRAACAGIDPYEELSRTMAARSRATPLDELIDQHYQYYLANQNLVMTDRASMRCGLEVRAPFLDHALVDLAGRIPGPLKLRGVTTKYILKRALRGLVPPDILRRRKQGFGVPIGTWLRGPLRPMLEDRLAPGRVARVGLFQADRVSRLVQEHLAGAHDHRKILWSLLVFDVWREEYLPQVRWT